MTKNIVYNNTIDVSDQLGVLDVNLNDLKIKEMLANLFEQFLLFDRIVIKTGRLSFSLIFLIKELGINKVEELIEKGYIKFLLWTPLLLVGTGRRRSDGTIDNSTIFGKPPIASGSLSDEDCDPERNIDKALSKFQINQDRRRIFKRLAKENYIIPEGMEFSAKSADFVIETYKANLLSELELPYETEPEYLVLEKRFKLLDLGNKAIETALLSKHQLKSYYNYEHFKICEANLKNIGNALKVSENTSEILRIENIINLKQLFIEGKLNFDAAFELRDLSNAKYFRKWINEVSESTNAYEISKEYLKEIKSKTKFFETSEGKFLRTISIFGLGSYLGYALAGYAGASIVDLGLSLLDTYWVDSILKGKNPSMFIDEIRNKIKNN